MNKTRTCQLDFGRASAATAVEGHDLEGCGLDAFEAADVDRGHGLARRVGAEAERCASGDSVPGNDAGGRSRLRFAD